MDKLKAYLMSILQDMESSGVRIFEKAELEYFMHYFHTLGRYPDRMEVVACMILSRFPSPGPLKVSGRKIDAFYAQPTVLGTVKPDLLDVPEIPSDVKPSNEFMEDKILDEEEAYRARTLMASSTHLPSGVISVLEDRYWIENNYTHRPGYHHYEHVEGEGVYELSFNRSDMAAAFSSNAGFIGIQGSDLKSMADVSAQRIHWANQAGFPTLCSWFYPGGKAFCVQGGFANVLPYSGDIQKIKPGDSLFLLGKIGSKKDVFSENQCQSVIFNAYALGDKGPVVRVSNLEKQSLIFAILDLLRASVPGSGVSVQLNLIPKPHSNWSWEDFGTEPLISTYLVVVPDYQKHIFLPIVAREACPCIEIGHVTELGSLVFLGEDLEKPLVDIAWEFLEHFPERSLQVKVNANQQFSQLSASENFESHLKAVLQQISVLDKTVFLTQMDRSCSGLVARDPMVGPWQVPVADVAVTATEFKDYIGEAMAVSVCNLTEADKQLPMLKKAFTEVITNLAASAIEDVSDMVLMVPRGVFPDLILQELKSWVGIWGISVREQITSGAEQNVLFLTGFAPVIDIRKTMTPQWVMDDETELMAVVWEGEITEDWKSFFQAIQTLNRDDLLLAYHDLSEGGLVRCLLEMAFCSHAGFSVNLAGLSPFKAYSGAIFQVRRSNRMEVKDFWVRSGFEGKIYELGRPLASDEVSFHEDEKVLFSGSRKALHRLWSEPGYELQKQTHNPISAHEAYDVLLDIMDPGLHETLTFDPNQNIVLPYISEEKPSIAILRFPGGQGHVEMASAFDRVGFECIDVSIMDILNGEDDLKHYVGLAVGGSELGGSLLPFADTLLESSLAKGVFQNFFNQPRTFALGTGHGCRWLAHISSWIPGTSHWPSFESNVSGRFESRWALVQVRPSASIFLKGMEGSFIPVPVACKHGKASFNSVEALKKAEEEQLFPLAYANHYEQLTEQYPFNPTGTALGACGFISQNGRVLGFMGHPERACRSSQQGWHHRYLQMDAPWLRLFRNARKFLD